MEAGEALFFVEAELAPLLAFDEAVEGFGDVHLRVERLVLLQKSSEEAQVALDLLHLAQELL